MHNMRNQCTVTPLLQVLNHIFSSRFYQCKKSGNHTCIMCGAVSSFIAFKAGICTKKEKSDLTAHNYVEVTSGGKTSVYMMRSGMLVASLRNQG